MSEQQKTPERIPESELFCLLAASYEFSQKDGHLQHDLMRVFRHLHPNLSVSAADIARFQAEGEATRTDYSAQQRPTVAMRMVRMINNARAHATLESGLASMRLELPHWEDYFAPFMSDDSSDPFPDAHTARDFLLKLIAQDEHYALKGRERNGVKVFYDYFVSHLIGDAPLPSGNTPFSKQTLPQFRAYVHTKLQEMPHELFTDVRVALGNLIDAHNESDPAHSYNKKELLASVEKIRHQKGNDTPAHRD